MDIEVLRSRLHYDPDTGALTWKQHFFAYKVGQEAFTTVDKNGYHKGNIRIAGVKKHVRKSRVCFAIHAGYWPETVDHINGIKTDDRWGNLRDATTTEQNRNRRIKRGGVYWHKQHNKWIAHIQINSKTIHLGYFEDKDAAFAARKLAEQQHGFHPNHGRPS